jgi:hypothetical protein
MTVTGPDGTQWPANSLRGIEHASIRAFVQKAADLGYLSGRVLDYGCGKQPYRDIVEAAGGTYFGFDLPWLPANVSDEIVEPGLDMSTALRDGYDTAFYSWAIEHGYFDAVLCTQVIQYVPLTIETRAGHHENMNDWLMNLRILMDEDSETLVLTYPTNWPEVEPEDLHRFTKAGMERLLKEAGFEIVLHEERARTWFGPGATYEVALGYGVIARA